MRAKWKKKRMRRLKRKRRKMRQRSKVVLVPEKGSNLIIYATGIIHNVDWNELHCVLRMLKASIPTECDLNAYDTRQICILASSLFRLFRRSLGMKGGLVILKLMRGMLGIFPPLPTWYDLLDQDVGENEDALPVDVKEGQFAVHTVDDGRLSRSVVELIYLTNPEFLKLLEQAEQEFGFGQMGILVIPCTYGHLQSVIGRK